tara:strand:+ start:3260 stop:3991 length:732 start_codon:yes stop_codon:yes gene_type:complete
MTAQFVTLDEVIQGLLVDEGKSSEHEYLRYFNIGLRGLKELNFDTVRQIKSVELQLDSKNTVTLPSDYVSYIKIGVADNNGNVSYMGIRENINFVPGTQSTTVQDNTENPPIFSYNNYDNSLWGRYGQGGGNNANGYYRENLNDRTIEFSNSNGPIILEYVSDGSTGLTGTEIKIHAFAEEALRSFIYWKSVQRKRAINMNEKMAAKNEYYNQKRLSRARMQSFNKNEALQTSRKAFKQSPKI